MARRANHREAHDTGAPRTSRGHDRLALFDKVIVGLMALGAVVVVEPAPFDLLILIIAPTALVLRRLAIPRASSFALICVGLFLVANTISLFAARDIGRALRYEAITLYLVIAWVVVVGLVGKGGERSIRVVMLGWAGGAVVTTALGLAGYFNLLPLREVVAEHGRLMGFFKDPNVFGAYLVAPAVWATSRLVSLGREHRLAWALVLVLCGSGVLLSYSRGAWISLALGLVMFFGLRLVGGTRRARLMTLVAVPVAAVLLGIALERLTNTGVVQDMLEIRFAPQTYDEDRFATQREAIEVAMRTPLGIGPGQTEGAFHRSAHNTYVRGFVENGYLGGLSIVVLMVASLLRATWLALELREPRLQVAMAVIAASLAAVAVESVVIDSIHWRHLWILAALAWVPAIDPGAGASNSVARSRHAPERT